MTISNHHIPDPPVILTDSQWVIWNRLFANLDEEWIPKSQYELTVAYVRHLDSSDIYADLLNQMTSNIGPESFADEEYIKSMDRLAKMIERETRAAGAIATRLRITNQSLRSSYSKAPAKTIKPWDLDDAPEVIDEDVDDEHPDS